MSIAVGQSRRVLLVAPPATASVLVDRIRAATGWDVTVAHHPRVAWSLFEPGRWRAVLCEDRLADGPGLALLTHVKAHDPSARAVLLSPHADDSRRPAGLDALDAHIGVRDDLEPSVGPLLTALGADDATPQGAEAQTPHAPQHPWPASADRPFTAPPKALPRVETPSTAPRRWSDR